MCFSGVVQQTESYRTQTNKRTNKTLHNPGISLSSTQQLENPKT